MGKYKEPSASWGEINNLYVYIIRESPREDNHGFPHLCHFAGEWGCRALKKREEFTQNREL